MKKIIHTLCLLNLLLILAPSLASASQGRAEIQAYATVNTVFNATLVFQAASIEITAADIARGYIDINQASVLDVQSNSRDGYYLSFTAQNHPFSEIWVIDQQRTTLLTDGNGYIHQAHASNKETKQLSYRFFLPKLLPPGSYAWPLQVSATTH